MDNVQPANDLPNLRTSNHPPTERGSRTVIQIDSTEKYLAYGSGRNVILRYLESIEEPFAKTRYISKHQSLVTCVSVSPDGNQIASGDETGTVLVSWENNFIERIKFEGIIPGKINGIVWSDDCKRLLIYGSGKKNTCKVVMSDSGNTLGTIAMHNGETLSGDFKKTRPYRIATGGFDKQVNFFEGPPFKLLKMTSEHTNFVNDIKFSPDSTRFLSVSSDRKLVIYDGKTGEPLETIAEKESAGNHNGAILVCEWLDNETFITGSLDATVKIWKGKEITTLNVVEKPEIEHKICGLTYSKRHIVVLTLNGDLNFYDRDKIIDGMLPTFIQKGHQVYVTKMVYVPLTKEIYSIDKRGRILVWQGKKVIAEIENTESPIKDAVLSGVDSILLLGENKVVYKLSVEKRTLEKVVELPLGDMVGITSAVIDEEVFYCASTDQLHQVKNGELNSRNLNYKVGAIILNGKEVLLGDSVG